MERSIRYNRIAIVGAMVLSVLIVSGLLLESPWLLTTFAVLTIPWVYLLRKYQ